MTSRTEFPHRILDLMNDGTPFAVATVVARRAPVSAHLGDRALIFADGRMDGFVGGACTREIVRQQALEVLRRQKGRLVTISPEGTGETSCAEHVIVPMTCASEGTVEVYIEPFVPAPSLVVVGATPVADALARLARTMDYAATRVVAPQELSDVTATAEPLGIAVIDLDALSDFLQAEPNRPAVVVASQGHYDEEALEIILAAGSPYVGLLASRQRASTVRAYLADRKLSGIDGIRSPVGLDLGARTPLEVALSILAEIVRDHRPATSGADAAQGHPLPAAAKPSSAAGTLNVLPPKYAVDPVCGMNVDMMTARHKAEIEGTTYYFCCPHCRAAFVEQPQQYRSFAT